MENHFAFLIYDIQLSELIEKLVNILSELAAVSIELLIKHINYCLFVLGLGQRIPYGGARFVDRYKSLYARRCLTDRDEYHISRDIALYKLQFKLHYSSSFRTL